MVVSDEGLTLETSAFNFIVIDFFSFPVWSHVYNRRNNQLEFSGIIALNSSPRIAQAK